MGFHNLNVGLGLLQLDVLMSGAVLLLLSHKVLEVSIWGLYRSHLN